LLISTKKKRRSFFLLKTLLKANLRNLKPDKKIIIAIDGYSGGGKGTLARQLARRLHYRYIDSGAMYRAITLYFLQNNIDLSDHVAIKAALKNISLKFVLNPQTGYSQLWLNGKNVEEQIRGISVTEKVSEVAAIPEVREFAVEQQRKTGHEKGIVMDGRDIGTVVFPYAELKIFLTADIAVRAERRFKELCQKSKILSLQQVKENLALRDHKDETREISPLKKAEDAVILDNSYLTPEEQLQAALEMVKEVRKEG
jgi:cytidylate kinase